MSVLLAGNIGSRATYRACPVCSAIASEPGPNAALRHTEDCKTRYLVWHKGLAKWIKRKHTPRKRIKVTKALRQQSARALERNAGELLLK